MGDWVPQVGMEFETLEAAWKYWVNYGKKMGFSVRKHYLNKSKIDGEITSRRFLCAKEGIRESKQNEINLRVIIERKQGLIVLYD
jgi:zinc finger SWIM domain-containing protein 3